MSNNTFNIDIDALTEDFKAHCKVIKLGCEYPGYTGKEKSMVVCAVKKNEVPHLTKIIRQVDTETFIIITEAGEILGEGFIAPGVN